MKEIMALKAESESMEAYILRDSHSFTPSAAPEMNLGY